MYKPVEKHLDFVEIEHRVLTFWEKASIFRKLREKNAAGPPWSFQDGPITANNPMGVHHAWGRSLKDIHQRYHAMLGHALRYQNGFDCQGLWVEVEVEKELGFASKRDIREYGIDRFVRKCKERVLTYAAKQTEQSIRLGYWMEWDDPEQLRALRDALAEEAPIISYTPPTGRTVMASPEEVVANLGTAPYGGSYFTFSSVNNFTIWGFLKKCHEEGFIHRSTDVMPWCPRCGTGLSQMEVTEGRKIAEHLSVFVRFPIQGREKEAFLVWTTTPWTLTSNVAVALHPEMRYLKIRHGEWTYYVGKENFNHKRVMELEAEGKRKSAKLPSLAQILAGMGGEAVVVEELPGSALLGLAYHGPFDDLEAQRAAGGVTPFGPTPGVAASATQCHRAIPWKEVGGTEGSGIVHIAPGCGAEDYRLGQEHGLVQVAPLNEDGEFIAGFGPFTGQHASSVAEEVVAILKEKGLLVAKEHYPHVYPHCWRCKTELLFRLVDGWTIRMDWRDRIQKVVPTIRWIPPDGEAREQDWLRNMGDWLISKKRFWGLALPIWECDGCGWFTVIGSEEELQHKAVAGWDSYAGHSPHRPFIDAVRIRCEQCGREAHRIEDVGNPWLDAGIVPFSTVNFHGDRDNWARWFPADLVLECFPGQFRNWFYALLAMSAMVDGRAPFKTLLGHALVRDERGEEMHKSKGNAIFFDEAAEVLGADVMRYLYASQNPAVNLNFPDLHHKDHASHPDVEVRRKLLTFWNCYAFFVSYASVDGWVPGPQDPPAAQRTELDRWILSRLQNLVAQAHTAFGDFAVHRFMEQFERFTDELSNWYLRRSRQRFWQSGMGPDKRAAFATLHQALGTVLQLLAPMLPFVTEAIYQNLVRGVDPAAPESIHLCDYPRVNRELLDPALERRMESVLRIKNAALALRNQCRIKVRQPLGKLLVKPRDQQEAAVLEDPRLAAQVLEECNIKTLELLADEGGIRVEVKPNFRTLGPKAGNRMKEVQARLTDLGAEALQEQLAQGEATLTLADGFTLTLAPEDLLFTYDAGDQREVLRDGGTMVVLDTRITPRLAREGVARDFNRLAQNLRKEAGLELDDRIHLRYLVSDTVAEALEENREMLVRELLAERLERVAELPEGEELTLGGEPLRIALSRAG